MRLTFCGIPPAQARVIEREFAGHDVLVIGAQDGHRRNPRPCDLLVVNRRLSSHCTVDSVKAHGCGSISYCNGPSSAIRVAQEWLANAPTNGR